MCPKCGHDHTCPPWAEGDEDICNETQGALICGCREPWPPEGVWFTVDSLAAALITLPAIAPGYVTDEEERMKAGRVIADAIIQAAKEAEREGG